MKKIFALALAMILVLSCFAALADETTQHTITITNNDQNVSHTYKAYQVFVGKLDAGQTKLSDIQWGSGVDGDGLLTALKADTTYGSKFTDCTTAADVADVLGSNAFQSTTGVDVAAGAIDEIAAIISNYLTTDNTKIYSFTESQAGKTYTATVTGDGYYFIKDVTTNLVNDETKGSDTKSKFLLAVVADTTIIAKDTGITPDKDILIATGQAAPNDYTRVKENTAAIGDVVPFEVRVDVPNTVKYDKDFWFKMNDTLCDGLTYLSFVGITIDGTALPADNYQVTVKNKNDSAYTLPADAEAAAKTVGGQKIDVLFKDFKDYVETNKLIDKQIVLRYNAVLNEKAEIGDTGNKNEVVFKYSNDPNHDYDGDWGDEDDVVGTTPKSETITYVTTLEILKKDGTTNNPLAGATFQIVSESYNMVVETGEKFEKIPYTLGTREERVGANDVYYLLKDGTYTKTASNSNTENLYQSTSDTYMKVKYTDVTKTVPSNHTETVVSGEDGLIKQVGLKPGTYTITETVAPEGYNKITDTFILEIDWIDPTDPNATDAQKAAGGFFIGSSTTKNDKGDYLFTMQSDGAKYEITINNFSGSTLPSTGGIGTTLFYVGGGILILLAVVMLVTKRRMSSND